MAHEHSSIAPGWPQDTVALAAQGANGTVQATASGEESEDKEEFAQIKEQDAKVIQPIEDDGSTKDEKEDAEADDLPDSSPEVMAQEKVAVAVEDADSDAPMDSSAEDEANEAATSDTKSDSKTSSLLLNPC